MSFSKKILSEWKKRKLFYIIMGLLFVIWLLFVIKAQFYDPNELNRYGAYTVAEITEYDKYGKGQPVTRYQYYVKGKIYEASMTGWLNICPEKNHCVGAKFKLLYSTRDPSIHDLLLDEQLADSITLEKNLEIYK